MGRHWFTVGHFFSKSFQTLIWITFYIEEQTHHLNSAVIYCLWRDNAHKPLQCTCTNQEQMDPHSMASKVNREVCQLKVNGWLFTTSVCFDFTIREKRSRGSDSGAVTTSQCFFLVCSLEGSRVQDLIRQLSFQFTKLAFDKGRMKPVLFILCSVRDCYRLAQHVFVGGHHGKTWWGCWACKFYWWIKKHTHPQMLNLDESGS